MTDEQINATIHAALGNPPPVWRCPYCGKVDPAEVTYDERHDVESCLEKVRWVVAPDYANDLNVMHDAGKVLTGVQQATMVANLSHLGTRWGLVATARQRAIAFIKTLNLTVQ